MSLKSTVDQLTLSLERAAGTESEMKAELQNLQRSLTDTTTATHTGAERLKNVTTTLTAPSSIIYMDFFSFRSSWPTWRTSDAF